MDDVKLNAVLDRFTAPPAAPDLAARISAAAQSRSTLPMWRRRISPRQWQRTRNIVIGSAATLLLSATAAASGWFGGQKVQIPVISTLVAKASDIIAPGQPKNKTKIAERPRAKVENSPSKAEPDQETLILQPLPPPEAIIGSPAEKRMRVANRVSEIMARRIEVVDARRAAKGLPPVTAERRALLERLTSAKSDDERKAALQAIRQVRDERIERQFAKKYQGANDPAREEMRERFRQRRLDRMRRWQKVQGEQPADPVPKQADAPMSNPTNPVE